MRHLLQLFVLGALTLLVSASASVADDGFKPIFDGKTLEGWDGDPSFWSVRDGAITGQTTADNPTQGNTFIIWRGGDVSDFELKLEYRIVPDNDRGFGNSGIQYRSFEVPNEKWVVGGYQGDFEAGDRFSGILYGERFRGILADRGKKTVIKEKADGKPDVVVVGEVGDSAEIQSKIKKEDWNDYHIIAKDYHFIHKINGVVTSECTDEHRDRRKSGILALQLHAGEPMTVQFRNIRLKKNGDAAAVTPKKHDAASAIAQLDVHPQLKATLFAAEPMMYNPTNIDIDHLGRVWVCEVINYRRFRNLDQPERKEGDRILILEDTDRDGVADKSTTFYQGRDIDSAHGICVLGTPSGKGTKALVSAKDSVFYLIDDDGDSKADRKKLLFTGISGVEHDHGIHAFVFGPDGKLYFNFGNEGKQLRYADGQPVIDQAGNEVAEHRNPYQQGMVFRCNLDGSDLETLGWNFRNNWEVCVDSFGTLWQSDNDDDGNRGTRINFVMEFGNYGYRDELTGAAWKQERTGMHEEIPKRHWHLNDPGVVPNLLQTGAGSPTGICIYEGTLLPEAFQNEMIHCDAGPNIVRSYPAKPEGAGYSAEMVSVLDGKANQWFRPSDVCVAPDGSLLVADWYDPGVGGHRMEDTDHGRLFRIVPEGHDGAYSVAAQDFATPDGAAKALQSPNLATRYIAWTALHKMGTKAESTLASIYNESKDQHQRARALWLLGKMDRGGDSYVAKALADKNPDIRIAGLRLARQLKMDLIPMAKKLVSDPSAPVRREVAIAIRHNKSKEAANLWADLAMQHDGKDRWYLEALGVGADKQWDRFLAAWMKKVGDDWATDAGRDIIWRSRAKETPTLLAKIITDPSTPVETHPRYLRAFDFHSGPEKDAALKAILGL